MMCRRACVAITHSVREELVWRKKVAGFEWRSCRRTLGGKSKGNGARRMAGGRVRTVWAQRNVGQLLYRSAAPGKELAGREEGQLEEDDFVIWRVAAASAAPAAAD